MTHQITFRPSGKTAATEAQETILDAGLRAGLSPVYGCSNGNCGTCKARLISGQIEKTRHHDHALSESDKVNGAFLMCANRALTDIVVAADVTQGPGDIPIQEIATRVKAIEHLDPRVANLHLQTPRSTRLRFIPGQSVTLAIDDDIQTTVALASCPCDDRNLMVHIPNIPGDAFSEHVFDGGLSLRDTVHLRGPETDGFVFDESDRHHSLVLCWFTGFAPVISLMEHAMSLEVEKDIHLYRFSPTPQRPYMPNLARSWADAYDNVFAHLMPDRISLMSTRQDCAAALSAVAAQVPDHAQMNIYVAGTPSFVEAARDVFDVPGGRPDRIRTHTDWHGFLD